MLDMTGRECNVGDYVLFSINFHSMFSILIGKVVESKEAGNLDVLARLENGGILIREQEPIYKLDINDTSLLEQSWINGRDGRELLRGNDRCFMHKDVARAGITDIFDRTLCLGDFVSYFRRSLGSYKLCYGILVDKERVLEYPNKVCRVKLVYKMENRSDKEKEIYKKLSTELNNLVNTKVKNSQIKKTVDNMQIGDVFKKGNLVYLYMGVYFYDRIYPLDTNIGIRNWMKYHYKMDIKDLTKHELFVTINLTTKIGQEVYQAIIEKKFDVLEKYLSTNKAKYYPSCFMGYSSLAGKRRMGDYLGNSGYKPLNRYICYYKDEMAYLYIKLN